MKKGGFIKTIDISLRNYFKKELGRTPSLIEIFTELFIEEEWDNYIELFDTEEEKNNESLLQNS